MVQVENEYGNYGVGEKVYTAALAKFLRRVSTTRGCCTLKTPAMRALSKRPAEYRAC